MGYTLVYDSGCGPCTRFRNLVAFLDPKHKMRYIGLDEAEDQGVLSAIPAGMRRRSFHLVSDRGIALSGSSAFPALASQLPGGKLTSAALKSNPAVSGLAGFAYSTLARLHEKGSCPTAQ